MSVFRAAHHWTRFTVPLAVTLCLIAPGDGRAHASPAPGAPARIAPRQIARPIYLPALYQGQRLAFQVTGQLGGGAVTAAELMPGDRAIVAVGPRLSLVSLATSGAPTVVGTSAPLTGTTVSLAVASGMAYASAVLDDAHGELRVFDVPAAGAPRLQGRLPLTRDEDSAGIVVAYGSAVYVADSAGLAVVDVRDGRRPTLADHVPTRAGPASLALAGGRLYVGEVATDNTGGVEVLDVSQALGPRAIGYLTLEQPAIAVLIRGSIAYVAGGEARPVAVVDVSRPTEPRRVGAANAASVLKLFAGAGGRLYAEAKVEDSDDEPYQLRTFEVDAASPTEWSMLGSSGLPPLTRLVAGSAGRLLEGDAAGTLAVLDGSAELPAPAGSIALCAFVLEWPVAAATDARFVYVVDRRGQRLNVLGAAQPERAQRIGSLDLPAGVEVADIAVTRSTVYLVAPDTSLLLVDVLDPSQPRLLGQWPEWAGEVLAVSGDVLLVGRRAGENDGALLALDIATPARPAARGQQAGLDVADVSVVGGVAYVSGACRAGEDEGFPCLTTVGAGSATLPVMASTKAQVTRSEPGAVSADGRFAFVSRTGAASVRVFDAASPVTLNPAGQFVDDEGATAAVGGNHRLGYGGERLWFGDALGLRVIDARRHTSPQLERRFAFPPSGGLDLALAGGRAYLVADDGVWVVERAAAPGP